MEIWKPVLNYEGLYEVSDQGEVRSLDRPTVLGLGRGKGAFQKGRVLKQGYGRGGYATVCLSKNGHAKTRSVHVIVLESFIGPRPAGTETKHYNGVRRDNRIENLSWGSRSENTNDQVRLGNHRNSRKTHCPRNHKLNAPNLSSIHLTKGQRICLACHRTRAYLKNHPELDFQSVSDTYYEKIMFGVENV